MLKKLWFTLLYALCAAALFAAYVLFEYASFTCGLLMLGLGASLAPHIFPAGRLSPRVYKLLRAGLCAVLAVLTVVCAAPYINGQRTGLYTHKLDIGSLNINPHRQYILNINTNRIHYPNCDSINSMKESNKQVYYGTLDALLSEGFVPCKICVP